MKTKTILSVLAIALTISAGGQEQTMELTFTALNNGQYVPLDSILIENLTQGGDTTLYAPDTVLVLGDASGIGDNEEIDEHTLFVSQNYPNPFKDRTEVDLYLPERDNIKITIRDILGRELASYEYTLDRGNHSFAFYSGIQKYYLLTVSGKQTCQTIKMLNTNSNPTYGEKCKIVYIGYEDNMIGFKSQKAINNFGFNLGDELMFTAYALTAIGNLGSAVIVDTPEINTIYEFDIIGGLRCPGMPTVTWEGQTYNTVLIGNQCWFKENLNYEAGNSWCYNNNPSNCDIYGRLYNWATALTVCPDGWHLPSDNEWKILEGTVDSQYPVGDPEWNKEGVYRGFDAGKNLKSISGWYNNGNGTDLYGFSALPGGYRYQWGGFGTLGQIGNFWTSNDCGSYAAFYRKLSFPHTGVGRIFDDWNKGYSVRCVRDN